MPPSQESKSAGDGDVTELRMTLAPEGGLPEAPPDDIYVWGHNTWGQLGLGHAHNVPYPEPVDSLREATVSRVACGGHHLVLLTLQDEVWVAGKNDHGQLGVGEDVAEERQPLPVLLEPCSGLRVERVACGYDHTVLVTREGALWTFGHNANGELGLGHCDPVPGPRQVAAFRSAQLDAAAEGGSGADSGDVPALQTQGMAHVRVVEVSSKGYHTLALTTDGEVLAWGKNNFGQLGLGHGENVSTLTEARAAPTRLAPLQQPLRPTTAPLSAGPRRRALAAEPSLPSPRRRVLEPDPRHTLCCCCCCCCCCAPRQVRALRGRRVCELACGSYHSVVLTRSDELLAFGDNNYGQLGLGDTDCRVVPEAIASLSFRGVGAVSCGFNHTMVLLPGEDAVFAFGGNPVRPYMVALRQWMFLDFSDILHEKYLSITFLVESCNSWSPIMYGCTGNWEICDSHSSTNRHFMAAQATSTGNSAWGTRTISAGRAESRPWRAVAWCRSCAGTTTRSFGPRAAAAAAALAAGSATGTAAVTAGAMLPPRPPTRGSPPDPAAGCWRAGRITSGSWG